ncbi:hypothetical protein ACFL21_02605 [Patescibacteria group bacterium]
MEKIDADDGEFLEEQLKLLARRLNELDAKLKENPLNSMKIQNEINRVRTAIEALELGIYGICQSCYTNIKRVFLVEHPESLECKLCLES